MVHLEKLSISEKRENSACHSVILHVETSMLVPNDSCVIQKMISSSIACDNENTFIRLLFSGLIPCANNGWQPNCHD